MQNLDGYFLLSAFFIQRCFPGLKNISVSCIFRKLIYIRKCSVEHFRLKQVSVLYGVYIFYFFTVKYYFILTLQTYSKDLRKMNRNFFYKESQCEIHFVEITYKIKYKRVSTLSKVLLLFLKSIEYAFEYQKNFFYYYCKSCGEKVFIESRINLFCGKKNK